MFAIGRNERYFVAIWILIRNCVKPSSHPMNNEIASVRVQLLLRNAPDLSVERFSRRGVRLNATGLIALSRLRPLRGFCRRDRNSVPQTHSSLRCSCKFLVRWTRYDWLEPAMRSMVCKCRLHVPLLLAQIDNRPLASLDDNAHADIAVSFRSSFDQVGSHW
jgi:hypothetical protein